MKQNPKNHDLANTESATATLLAKGHAIDKADSKATAPVREDKRETARHEHTHHFTNRASGKSA